MTRRVVTTIKTGCRSHGHNPGYGDFRISPIEDPVADDRLPSMGEPPAQLGASHWSARLMAERLGISFASVARIWRKWNIQPVRVETFRFSTDPQLEAELRDVVGLYLHSPADDDRADHPMVTDRRGMLRRPETDIDGATATIGWSDVVPATDPPADSHDADRIRAPS